MTYIDLSQVAREIDHLRQAVFKDIGDAFAAGVWDEFKVLLMETPQWSGTTAASWNLSMGGDTSVRHMPAPKGVNDALQRGHGTAIAVAEAHNFKSLLDISTAYGQKALMVQNEAPGADTSEHGPVRAVNAPASALARFTARVSSKHFEMLRDREF